MNGHLHASVYTAPIAKREKPTTIDFCLSSWMQRPHIDHPTTTYPGTSIANLPAGNVSIRIHFHLPPDRLPERCCTSTPCLLRDRSRLGLDRIIRQTRTVPRVPLPACVSLRLPSFLDLTILSNRVALHHKRISYYMPDVLSSSLSSHPLPCVLPPHLISHH